VEPDWARPVVHWEIIARDPAAQAAFYRRLCNWEIGDGPLMNIAPGLGAPEAGPAGHIRQGESAGVALYIQVRDLSASLALAESLGAKISFPPFDVPDGPTIGGIEDPEGNAVMLVQQ
jgi:hypothetical protein